MFHIIMPGCGEIPLKPPFEVKVAQCQSHAKVNLQNSIFGQFKCSLGSMYFCWNGILD